MDCVAVMFLVRPCKNSTRGGRSEACINTFLPSEVKPRFQTISCFLFLEHFVKHFGTPMEKNSNSKGKKRVREEDETESSQAGSNNNESLSLENSLTFSDTMIALRIMHAQFPKLGKASLQPFILRSQLYSSVNDRTQVDRDLESLKKEKVLRIFKLNTGQDDDAIMFMEDYLNQISTTEKRMGEKGKDQIAVLDWFKSFVIASKVEPSIEHQELCSLLSLGGQVKDESISLLIHAGLLTRQLIDSNLYWFAIPNIGPVLKALSQGRKELMSFLSRRKYKEMQLALLEKKRLHMSSLDMRFHLRDLIGSGKLKTLQTPTGLVVQVSKD